MARGLEFTKQALKDLERLPDREADVMLEALETFAATGHGDVRKMRGTVGFWRLRCGDWRAIFTADGQVLTVYRVRHRREVYR